MVPDLLVFVFKILNAYCYQSFLYGYECENYFLNQTLLSQFLAAYITLLCYIKTILTSIDFSSCFSFSHCLYISQFLMAGGILYFICIASIPQLQEKTKYNKRSKVVRSFSRVNCL